MSHQIADTETTMIAKIQSCSMTDSKPSIAATHAIPPRAASQKRSR
jgi:hypothetical protein